MGASLRPIGVRVLPGDHSARIRSIQVHGRITDDAVAGDRVAIALTGDGGDRELVGRGSTLVNTHVWEPTWIITGRVELLRGTGWKLAHNQRVHAHVGTSEALARVVLLEDDEVGAGEEGWVQLRFESPIVARAGDRFVIRSYSPVTTIGGGLVAEAVAAKRGRITDAERASLVAILGGAPGDRVQAVLELRGWDGVTSDQLPLHTGLTPASAAEALQACLDRGVLFRGGRAFSRSVSDVARQDVLRAVEQAHAADPLRLDAPLATVRAGVPKWAPPEVADAAIEDLVSRGQLVEQGGGVRLPTFQAVMTPDQEAAADLLLATIDAAGLACPTVEELPTELTGRTDFQSLLRRLASQDQLRAVADGLYVSSTRLDEAEARVRAELGGRTALSPADFKEILAVTRKHLIPLLNYLDQRGVTERSDGARTVPTS